MGVKTLAAQIEDGTTKAEGNTKILEQLGSMMVVFDPRFEIMPEAKRVSPKAGLNTYEVGPINIEGD